MIGSEIRRPLYADKLTRMREQLTFAHILVEVDPTTLRVTTSPIQLPTEVNIDLNI